MTHAQRNDAISRKIAAYTAKYTASRAAANAALKREGLDRDPSQNREMKSRKRV
jgi:hypothetical protein